MAFLGDGGRQEPLEKQSSPGAHHLNEEERPRILLNSKKLLYLSFRPLQIVPTLADQVEGALKRLLANKGLYMLDVLRKGEAQPELVHRLWPIVTIQTQKNTVSTNDPPTHSSGSSSGHDRGRISGLLAVRACITLCDEDSTDTKIQG